MPVQESTEANCRFNVIQPGSSVATALSEGESKKKHVVLLEIMGEQYRTINLPLYSVRPFVHESVSDNLLNASCLCPLAVAVLSCHDPAAVKRSSATQTSCINPFTATQSSEGSLS